MNIELSKNKRWNKLLPKQNNKKLENKLNKAWNTWKPTFITNYIKKDDLQKCKNWINELKTNKINYLIIIGMGGSLLGAKVIQKYAFQDSSKIIFWEGTHPFFLREYSKIFENQSLAILWISKSGVTLEARANLATIREFFDNISEYFITSYPSKILDICNDEEKILKIPKNLGGRFSIISPAGIMPALFMGANVQDFLNSFCSANDEYHIAIPLEENKAKKMACEFFALFNSGFYGVIFWIYSKELLGWGDWIVQLWGESLGKNKHIEVLPYLLKGPEDQHSLLQFFQDGPNKFIHIFCHTKSYAPFNAKLSDKVSGSFVNHTLWEILQAQMKGVEYALNESERPIAEYLFPQIFKDNTVKIEADMGLMGKWIGYWMHVVTYLGYLYNIKSF